MATGNNLERNIGRYWIDKPQSLALTPGFFVHIFISYVGAIFFKISWFIGVFTSCVLAAVLINRSRRRYILISPISLVNVSAIISIAASWNESALITSRNLNGIAIVLTTVSFVIHGSEIASKYHRGLCLSLEKLCLTSGASIQIISTENLNDNSEFNPFCMQDILCLIFGVFAVITIFTKCTTIDSPVQNLLKVQLYRPPIMNNNKEAIFKEHVVMNEPMTRTKSFISGLSPLARLLAYRSMLAFIRGLPLTDAFTIAVEIGVGRTSDNWARIVTYDHGSVNKMGL
ncbi:uncharacterized protein [Eurosta solidaginis]|uniref:uncharacterized protein n=1 Tax=Eurosta solidaginis TaxID=178769 RepID=UPI0035316248